MRPEDMAKKVEAFLLAHVDAEFAQGQRRFFREEVDTYGVRTAHVKELVKEVWREVKGWPAAERDSLMELLWETGKLEPGVVVCHVYRRLAKSSGTREFEMFEGWIDLYVRNWAHADGVASWLVAACIENRPELRFRLVGWATSGNRWRRRCAAVGLLQEAKAGRHTEFVLEQAGRLLKDRDDMVEKGVGWLLKEAYPKRPREVVAFLVERGGEATRQTLRYAAEKMSVVDRAKVLAVTASGGR